MPTNASDAARRPALHAGTISGRRDRAADRRLVDDRAGSGARLHHVAVATDDSRHARRTRELRVLLQMPRLAVHGDGDLRPHPAVHLLQLLAARMAGDVHQRIAIGDDLAAEIEPAGSGCAPTARSLPGMVREEKMTRSPFVELDLGMLVLGDARERGARLALAAGAQQHHLVAAPDTRSAAWS